MADETHVIKVEDKTPEISLKVEKNSRGYNFEAKVVVRGSLDDAHQLLRDAISKLRLEYGGE